MTDLVAADQIEPIVGARRHPTHHLGRAVSAEQVVYILHSQTCKDSGLDLRECGYSRALDRGIDPGDWTKDVTVGLVVEGGALVPLDFLPADVEPTTCTHCHRRIAHDETTTSGRCDDCQHDHEREARG